MTDRQLVAIVGFCASFGGYIDSLYWHPGLIPAITFGSFTVIFVILIILGRKVTNEY